MLEEERTNGHRSADLEADGDRYPSKRRQFRRRTTKPWSGKKLLEFYRRDRGAEETAVEFLNALRKLACEAGFIDCGECSNRDMIFLGRIVSDVGDESITDHILGLDAVPTAEEIDRICETMGEQRATTMPPLKRKKQWAAATVSEGEDENGRRAAKRRSETEATATLSPRGPQSVTHYDCVSATSVAGTLVINGETLVSKVRQRRRGSSDAATRSHSTSSSPGPLTIPTSPTGGPGSPTPVQSDGNYAMKVSPPHGAIEFGTDESEYPLPPPSPPPSAQRRPVYVRPIASLMAEPPSTSSLGGGRSLPDTTRRPGAPVAAPARSAEPITDVVPAKRGGGKGTRLKELLPEGWPLTVEQTANMDMQKLEHMMAVRHLSTEDVEKVKQVRRLEKNRRAAKKSRSNTVQAMEKLRYALNMYIGYVQENRHQCHEQVLPLTCRSAFNLISTLCAE